MRIKGQGRVTKYICKKIANRKQKKFEKFFFSNNFTLKKYSKCDCNFDIISFSSKKDISQQFFSILSFIHNVGIPKSWTIYSDGTHQEADKNIFKRHFDFVKIINWDKIISIHPQYNFAFDGYIKKYGLGKKAYILMNQKRSKPYLFVDSDILFYPKFFDYIDILNKGDRDYFMIDNDWCCLSKDYMDNNKRDMFQVNSGLLFIRPDFDWKPALEYLSSRQDKNENFDEQTSVHVTFFTNRIGLPFDPRLFKVEMSDHFKFSYAHTSQELAARHFVGPLRHKMWQKGWK